jgi:hypothetical protein
MADKKISQLPIGNLDSNTIFPIVTSGITSQTTFANVVYALEPYFSGATGSTSESNHYVRGWEIEKEIGNSITIGYGKGKLLLTNGSNQIIGTNGVDFDNQDNFDSPFYQYEATVILSDGTRRYIALNNNTGSTIGDISEIYSDNRYKNSLGTIWTGTTGEYQYYPYFIPEASGELNHAEGYQTQANGKNGSHAEGYQTIASGTSSHAEGRFTIAGGNYSHAEGVGGDSVPNQANGFASHVQGNETIANERNTHAGGFRTIANGDASLVHGYQSIVNGNYSIVLGRNLTGNTADTTYVDNLNVRTLGGGTPIAGLSVDANGFVVSGSTGGTSYWSAGTGNNAVATVNGGNIASGDYSLAEGLVTTSSAFGSHSEGVSTVASGQSSHAEGNQTSAFGGNSHAEGLYTKAEGFTSHAEGNSTTASGSYSHAEGLYTRAEGHVSHAEGSGTTAIGQYSHAQGFGTSATSDTSHAEGYGTLSSGVASHAEGFSSKAIGNYSHAECFNTQAFGLYSHAEGLGSIASGTAAHAEGWGTQANGEGSHSGGEGSRANGQYSFVHGNNSQANGISTMVLGSNIIGNENNTTFVEKLSLGTAGPYANDAAADADISLASGGLYTLTGSRAVYRKP